MAEFVTRAVPLSDGLRLVRVQLFIGKVLDRLDETHLDAKGRAVVLVRFAPDGTRLREEPSFYNETGEKVRTAVYDGTGRLITEFNELDDW